MNKGDVLAEKKPLIQGVPGTSIFGINIPVNVVIDPPFIAGPGAVLSENGLVIIADKSGQPHVDAIGKITVNTEFIVDGDVNYETGNLTFDGNIVVKGTVKQGFTVKGVSLTANEIEGAIIDLTGDLNVSAGISDTTIKTVGNVQTKFINNSTVLGFGNIIVLKEIIDSNH